MLTLKRHQNIIVGNFSLKNADRIPVLIYLTLYQVDIVGYVYFKTADFEQVPINI